MDKRRLIFILKEGTTTNELFKNFKVTNNPKALFVSPDDTNANGHKDPILYETTSSERSHYKSSFYNALGKQQKITYRTFVIDLDNESEMKSYLNHLDSKRQLIDTFYEDGVIEFFQVPTDPEFFKQRDLYNKLHVEEAWDLAIHRGQNVIVSVIDTGVEVIHNDLTDNLWRDKNNKIGFVYAGSSMLDRISGIGHGTPITGIIAASGNNIGVIGIAPRCMVQMHMLDVTGDQAFMSSCEIAIDNSENSGARIVNCSFGVKRTSQEALDRFVNKINQASKKMLFIFATGNRITGGIDISTTFLDRLPDALKVGALELDDTIANDSNFGNKVVYGYKNIHTAVKGNTFNNFSGTSAATPQIASICALVLGHNSNISSVKLKQIIEESCDKIPSIPVDKGIGKANARSAMEAALKEFGTTNL